MTTSLRTRIGQVLLVAAAAAAALAMVAALAELNTVRSDVLLVETWRAFGLGVFAGIFALLAWRPHALPGLWELVIAHKAALTLAAAFSREAADADTVLVSDGLLVVALGAAYVLLDGHRAWRRDSATDEELQSAHD